MLKAIKNNFEPNRKLRLLELLVIAALLVTAFFSYYSGSSKTNSFDGTYVFNGMVTLERQEDLEDYDEDSTVCDVVYSDGERSMIVTYSYEDYLELEDESIEAYEYLTSDGASLCFDHENPTLEEARETFVTLTTNETMATFNLANGSLILMLSVLIMMLFAKAFTTYEKIWFVSIMALATVVSVLFPEESANGVNGIIIMLLYLADTFFNILCELLISKQSRYNFLVSVVVEILEIAICIVLMYRFATMVTTLFFWLPIDILSFINWSKHKDENEDELTAVRRLKGYQEVLIILAIIIWTVVVGYYLSGLDIQTDFFGNNRSIETAVAYIDACASAVGVANGLFIFFRLREQWIAWYICAGLEALINIISGQYVLLVLKLGYFTNTTYGYIKWTRYIRKNGDEKKFSIL